MAIPWIVCGESPRERKESREDVLLIHADGTYESVCVWQYGGNIPPDFGAFAENYQGAAQVDSVVLDVTRLFGFIGTFADIYVWGDEGGVPGEVLRLVEDVWLLNVPSWPTVGRNCIGLPEPVCVGDTWWVGFWGRWPNNQADFFIAADLDGPGGGSPMTKIAPGQGFPTGWHGVALVWGPTAALGIGAVVEECPTPVESETWGSIKALYR